MRSLIVLALLPLLSVAAFAENGRWDFDALGEIDPQQMGYMTHSTLLVGKDGRVLWSWGDLDEKLEIFSMRKSVLSTMFGLLIAENQVNMNATLGELSIDDKQALSDSEKTATIADLLAAKSGVYHPAAYETPKMRRDRPARGAHLPGTHWFYNNWDYNALNTIFEQLSGHSVGPAFKAGIADPTGMQDFEIDDVSYVVEDASSHPAVTFRFSASDLAKFAVLMMNEGKANGHEVVPADWIRRITSAHTDLGMFGGYGLSWWVAQHGDHLPRLRFADGTYSARGTGEQMILVIPALDVAWIHRTKVTSPAQEKMHITESTRLLSHILATHSDFGQFIDPRFGSK